MHSANATPKTCSGCEVADDTAQALVAAVRLGAWPTRRNSGRLAGLLDLDDREVGRQEAQREEFFGPQPAALEPPKDPAGWGPTVQYLVEHTTSEGGDLIVDPALSETVGQDSRSQIKEKLAASAAPLHLAYVRSSESRVEGKTDLGLAEGWARMARHDGHYVVLFDDGRSDVAAYGMDSEISINDTDGQPAATLLRMASTMQDWPIEPERPEDWAELDEAQDPAAIYGVNLALVAVGFVVLPAFLLVRFVVARWRRAGN